MRDHLIAKDFKVCTLLAEYADLLHNSIDSCAVAAVNTDYEVAISDVSGDCCAQEFSQCDKLLRSLSRKGRGSCKTPGPHQDDNEVCFYHNTCGDKARKCKPSWQWAGNGQAAGK